MILTNLWPWNRSRSSAWYELIDPIQGYNNAKFETLHSNSVREKANDKVFVKSGNISIVSLEYVWQ